LKKEAQDISDDESENLMVERITDHQKSIWMLKSIIKQDS
jgi:DNA-binding ferritin-like protein